LKLHRGYPITDLSIITEESHNSSRASNAALVSHHDACTALQNDFRFQEWGYSCNIRANAAMAE
jgi:hypothetical protein